MIRTLKTAQTIDALGVCTAVIFMGLSNLQWSDVCIDSFAFSLPPWHEGSACLQRGGGAGQQRPWTGLQAVQRILWKFGQTNEWDPGAEGQWSQGGSKNVNFNNTYQHYVLST